MYKIEKNMMVLGMKNQQGR